MTSKAEQHDLYQACPVAGEMLPLWLAMVLIVVGVFGCLYLTYSKVYPFFQIERYGARPIPQNQDLSTNSTNISSVNHPVIARQQPTVDTTSLIEPPKTLATEINNPKPQSFQHDACPPLPFIFFKFDKVEPITDHLKEKMEVLKKWLAQHPHTKIILEGHADMRGSDEINLLFSYRRVNGVKAIFVKAGLPPDQIIIKAYGKQELVSNELKDADKNRRVTISTDSAQVCINPLFDGNLKQ